jgi:hypothetical protein
LTTWSFDDLRELFAGDDRWALYMEQADHHAVFFHHDGRVWLATEDPRGKQHLAFPEAVEDWLGAAAPKEPGVEPVLLHREELPSVAARLVAWVVETDPEHPVDEFDRKYGE